MGHPAERPAAPRLTGAYQVVAGLYLAGLVLWLGIGVIPPLTHLVPAVRHLVEHLAAGGPLAPYAARTGEGAMASGPAGVVALAYTFSALNLALGVLLLLKRPHDPVPRLLALAFMGTAATFNEPSHEFFHVLGDPPLVKAVHFTFHVVSGVAYLWAVVLFPDGTLPVGRALPRPVRRALALALTTGVAVVCWRSSFILHPPFFAAFFGVLVPVVGLAAQTARLRSSRDTVREQQSRLLRVALLPAFAAALLWLVGTVLGAAGMSGASELAAGVQDVFPAVFAVVPVMLFVAILRHRLWDIDILASRTLLLALLLAVIGLVYLACLAVTGWLLQGAGLAVLVPLVVVAVVAEPVRQLGQRWCNRLVFGTQLSPREAVRALVDRFSGAGEGDDLAELTRVVVESTRATRAAVWLLRDTELLRLAEHPAPTDGPWTGGPRLAAPTLLACEDALRPARCRPVSYEGELLGVLAVTTPRGVALTTVEVRLLDDLARHAGLLVANARLTVDLARELAVVESRTAELRLSRQRLVQAQDHQRRRLERDIHDGAQQQLVGLLIQLGVLQRASAPATSPLLAGVSEALAATRQTLRTLAAGGAPPELVDQGLPAALEAAAAVLRRSGTAVTVEAADVPRLPPEAEAALYFCCAEALQNVAKHARAFHVEVRVVADPDGVAFAVSDDGVGFAPHERRAGSGLGHLVERLTALGGFVEVTSGPGPGTVVRGRLPLLPTPVPEPDPVLTGARSG